MPLINVITVMTFCKESLQLLALVRHVNVIQMEGYNCKWRGVGVGGRLFWCWGNVTTITGTISIKPGRTTAITITLLTFALIYYFCIVFFCFLVRHNIKHISVEHLMSSHGNVIEISFSFFLCASPSQSKVNICMFVRPKS